MPAAASRAAGDIVADERSDGGFELLDMRKAMFEKFARRVIAGGKNLQRRKSMASAAATSSRHSITPGEIRETLSHIRRSAQTPAWSDGHSDGSSGLGRLKQTSLARVSMPSEVQM